jgi:hypothetical protein
MPKETSPITQQSFSTHDEAVKAAQEHNLKNFQVAELLSGWFILTPDRHGKYY